ncbi:MAG: formylmethanofuran dehydrogenase subunit E family protein [Syntrophales bacterium]|jgi:formylmethanofuran dehydrogenase subunit E|nr:formylmethanofuran dehydrogenase subunit E family protein [Syntrophales bacterium]MDY0044646.1 formylmethanofuran dehydrogenase subunit E family protein [Syntrophales bacterium]
MENKKKNNRETQKEPITECMELYWCHDYKGRSFSYEEALKLIANFHGNATPGLVMGVKMVTLAALERFNVNTPFDAVCETRGCLPDAVQILTPCTVGNGRLRINDMGRYAITFYDKTSGRGVRVSIDPEKLKLWKEYYDWFFETKPYSAVNYDLLMTEIRKAGEDVLRIHEIELIV